MAFSHFLSFSIFLAVLISLICIFLFVPFIFHRIKEIHIASASASTISLFRYFDTHTHRLSEHGAEPHIWDSLMIWRGALWWWFTCKSIIPCEPNQIDFIPSNISTTTNSDRTNAAVRTACVSTESLHHWVVICSIMLKQTTKEMENIGKKKIEMAKSREI